jgi:hypothetical protein
MEAGYKELEQERNSLLSKPLQQKEQKPSFRQDATLSFKPRVYYFDREVYDGREATYLTGGGSLEFVSGRYKDLAAIGITYAYSGEIDIKDDDVSVGLLTKEDEQLSVVSEVYLRLDSRKSKLSAVFYRQSINLPYLNRQDARMIPTTFEAYRVSHGTKNTDYSISYIDKIKRRNSDKFVSMSKQAGAASSNGVIAIGGRFDGEHVNAGALNLYNKDTINIFYTETDIKGSFAKGIDYQLAAQFTDQRSVGNEAIGNFQTNIWGVKAVASWRHVVLDLKYTQTDENRKIASPWGGKPHYVSLMLEDFDRAGETSKGVTLSYSFNRWNQPDWSMIVKYAKGEDAQDEFGLALEDQEEFDITLDYKPQTNRLKDLWVRARYAETERGDRTRRDFRLVINYPITLF